MNNYSFMNPVKDIDTSFYMTEDTENIKEYIEIYKSSEKI